MLINILKCECDTHAHIGGVFVRNNSYFHIHAKFLASLCKKAKASEAEREICTVGSFSDAFPSCSTLGLLFHSAHHRRTGRYLSRALARAGAAQLGPHTLH